MQSQLDFIFFVYGLSFLLLGVICLGLRTVPASSLPWKYLAMFALLHGTNEWLDMLALSLGDSDGFSAARLVMMTVSFVYLVEFGRAGVFASGGRAPGRWILLPLIAVAAIGGLNGMSGANAAARYALALPGGFWSAWALWREARKRDDAAAMLIAASVAMALYGLAAGGITPKAEFVPASFLHHGAFLDAVGIPVQLVRGLLASVIAMGVWRHYELLRSGSHHESRMERRYAMALGGLILVVLLGGGLLTEWAGRREKHRQCQHMQEVAQQAVAGLMPAHVANLSGSADDVNNPFYLEIKKHLQVMRSAMPQVRFLYLMRQAEGRVIFLADSEAPGSKEESPPGQVYEEATSSLKNMFHSGEPFVEGPNQDRWGSWVSGFYPIRTNAGGLIAVLGVDQDARLFQAAVATERLLAIGLTAMVCLALLLGFVYRWRLWAAMTQGGIPETYDPIVAWGPAAVVGVVGMTLTAAIFLETRRNAMDSFRETFQQQASVQVDALRQPLDNALEDLTIASTALGYSAAVQRDHFNQLVNPMTASLAVQAIAWAPRVAERQRADFEAATRLEGLSDYRIIENDAGGKPVAAAPRWEYFPVQYVEPLNGNQIAVGFDMGSNPQRRQAMENARDRGDSTATPPVRLLSETENQSGFLVFTPVYAGGVVPPTVQERRANLRGFVLGVYRVGTFVQRVLQKHPDMGLCILLEDLGALPENRTLYRHASNRGPVDWNTPHEAFRRSMDMAERDWQITVVPDRLFIENHRSQGYWWVIPSGLSLTALMGLYLKTLLLGRLRAEVLIRARTAELAKEKERLGVTLRSIGDGMIATDAAGCVVMMNRVAETLTGWQEAAAAGRIIEEIFHIVHAKTRQTVDNPIRQAIREGHAVELANHTALIARDGIERQIADSAAPIRTDQGKLVGVVLVFRDVTEDYRLREEVRASQQKLAQAADLAQIVHWEYDVAAGCFTFDDRFYALYGTTAQREGGFQMPAEVYAREFVHPDEVHMVAGEIGESMKATDASYAKQLEHRIIRRDGQIRHLVVRYGITKDSAGQTIKLHGANQDITERKTMEEELRTAARVDKLTGLPNRALLLDRLQHSILRHQRAKESKYAVLFLDFDRFKTINDSLGHEAGDQLLCEISRRLQGTVRAVDSVSRQVQGATAARLGGDEFVVLLDSLASADDADTVAQRLLDALSTPFKLGGHEIVSTASIGIVTSEYGHERAEDVLRDADTAMYEAKLAGRGRAVLFDGTMRDRVRRKLELENGLRKALAGDQFLLHYQPIVSLQTRRLEGFEALVRWRHPVHGMISPGEFIPVAEETGLIVPLGEWVFREACRQLSELWKTFGRDAAPSISVNLSRNQLAIPGLARRFRDIAIESGVEPTALHLEVTESAIMADTRQAAEVVTEMRSSGFKVDMDDFGTGYSSLACLHQFSIDVLKIDRSFIANLDRGRDFAALVNAIVMLAQNLGMSVIAEGVETEAQVVMLQSLECQQAQGYYFSRPMPADAIGDYLARAKSLLENKVAVLAAP